MLGPLLKVQMWFCVAGTRDCAPCQEWAKCGGFGAVSKTMAGVGHVKRICKDVFSVAGAVQETCWSEMIRAVRRSGRWFPERGCIFQFWEDDFAWRVQHFVWPGITFSCAAQYFRQMERKNRKNALVRGRQLCTQLSIFEGSLAELLRFWCCQLKELRKSRRLASFLMLSSAKMKEVSLTCCVFDVVKFKNWGSLAE